MLDFVLCDDNFNALTRLEKMLESLFIECKINACIALSTTNPEELIEYVKVNNVNVVFLTDVELTDCFSDPLSRHLNFKNCVSIINLDKVENMVCRKADSRPFCHLSFGINYLVRSVS